MCRNKLYDNETILARKKIKKNNFIYEIIRNVNFLTKTKPKSLN